MKDKHYSARQSWLKYKARAAINAYPHTWHQLIDGWDADASGSAAWLTYSANYLLQTAGVRWALDPFSLLSRVGSTFQPNFATDLASLQLVVLSHKHSDHFDTQLLTALVPLNLTWVVPEFMLTAVSGLGLTKFAQVIVPEIGVPIHFSGLTLIPFNALHIRGSNGVPELGYLADFGGKRWLFPGDTRTYDFVALPDFGKLDGVFAHLWLGKAQALTPNPPLLNNFYQFFSAFKARHIVITHLYELGRNADDCWTRMHYAAVKRQLQLTSPHVAVSAAYTGKKVIL